MSDVLPPRTLRFLVTLGVMLFGSGCTGTRYVDLQWDQASCVPTPIGQYCSLSIYADSLVDSTSGQVVGQERNWAGDTRVVVLRKDVQSYVSSTMRDVCFTAGFTVEHDPKEADLLLRTTVARLRVEQIEEFWGSHFEASAEMNFEVYGQAADSLLWAAKKSTFVKDPGPFSNDKSLRSQSHLSNAYNLAIHDFIYDSSLLAAIEGYSESPYIQKVPKDSQICEVLTPARWDDRKRQYDESKLWAGDRSFRWGVEFYTGGASYEDITHLESSDSIPYDLGNTAQYFSLLCASRVSAVSMVARYDVLVKPWVWFILPAPPREPPEDVPIDNAYLSHLQLFGSLGINAFGGRFVARPRLGYGWRSEWAKTKLGGAKIRNSHLHDRGMVYGMEGTLRFNTGVQFKSLYTYGDYDRPDRLLRTELRFSSSRPNGGLLSLDDLDRRSVFCTFGLQIERLGSRRGLWMLFLGAGLHL